MAGFAPIDDGFINKPGLSVMLREYLGLAVHQLRRLGFKRRSDLPVQLLSGAAQQAVVRRVLPARA